MFKVPCGNEAAVAPFTGAWIETGRWPDSRYAPNVAPFTGAWIETAINLVTIGIVAVAPFTGAWIETGNQ